MVMTADLVVMVWSSGHLHAVWSVLEGPNLYYCMQLYNAAMATTTKTKNNYDPGDHFRQVRL